MNNNKNREQLSQRKKLKILVQKDSLAFEFAKLLATVEFKSIFEQALKEVLSFGFGEFIESYVDEDYKTDAQEKGSGEKELVVELVVRVEVNRIADWQGETQTKDGDHRVRIETAAAKGTKENQYELVSRAGRERKRESHKSRNLHNQKKMAERLKNADRLGLKRKNRFGQLAVQHEQQYGAECHHGEER